MEKEDMQEKQVSEEEVSKQQDGQQDVDAPQLNAETTVSDNMGMHLINQQALQSQYIEKLEKLLLPKTCEISQNVFGFDEKSKSRFKKVKIQYLDD